MTDLFPIVVTALAALVQGCRFRRWPPIHGDSLAGLGGARRHGDHGPVGWLMVASLVANSGRTPPPGHSFQFSQRFRLASLAASTLSMFFLACCSSRCSGSRSWHSLDIPYENNLRAPPRLSTICDRSRSTIGLHGGRAERQQALQFSSTQRWRVGRKTAFEQIYRPYSVVSTISVIGLTVGNFFSESSILLSLKLIPGVLIGARLAPNSRRKFLRKSFENCLRGVGHHGALLR